MINKALNKITKYPLLMCFLVCIFATLLAYLVGEDNEFSPLENRMLSTKPAISISSLVDGTFMEEFEAYVKDQLPLRNELIEGKAIAEVALLSNENNGIIKGADGYLFEKVVASSGQLNKNISAIKAFAKGTDRNVYVLVAPTSVSVLRDKLPVGAPVLDEQMAMRNLKEALKDEPNAIVVDIYDEMAENINNEQLYYRLDHHWTTNGAYIAYRCLGDKLGFDAVSLNDFDSNKIDDFYGTYNAKYKGLLARPDEIIYYDIPIDSYICDDVTHDSLYDEAKKDEYDKYALFMWGNPGIARVTSGTCSNGRSLVVLKDSYANSVLPFLTCSYENIVIMDLRYYGGSVSEVINENESADILLLYNWSFVNEDNHFYKIIK